jgi:hypothetical protein
MSRRLPFTMVCRTQRLAPEQSTPGVEAVPIRIEAREPHGMDEHPGQGLRRVSASSFHPDILRGFARRRAFWYFETAQVIEPA